MLRVGAEHCIGCGNRQGKHYNEKKKDYAGVICFDTVTPPVIVQGLPPRNQFWEVILKGEKGCETGNGVGIGFSLCRCKRIFYCVRSISWWDEAVAQI